MSTWAFVAMHHCRQKKQNKLTYARATTSEHTQESIHSNALPLLNLKTEKQDCSQMCRICLKNEGNIPIFSGSVDISQDLNTFTGINIRYEDTFPKLLCQCCNALLQGAILLKKTAQESDQILRQSIAENCSLPDNNIESCRLSLDSVQDTFDSDEDGQKSIKMFQQKNIKSEGKQSLYCKRCEVGFATSDKYTEHVMSPEHENLKKTCPVCHKSYNYLYYRKHLTIHEILSNGKDCNVCDVCGKKFPFIGQLNRHRVTHFLDDLPFKCNLCPYRGRFSESLKSHMITHTGAKSYQCPHCPTRYFINKSNLNRHMQTHRSDYDFKCTQCSRGFFKKRDLDIHFKVDHTGIKDFICNICGKAFGYRKQMMKHQLKVHKRDKMRAGRTPLYVLMESKRQLEASSENLQDLQ